MRTALLLIVGCVPACVPRLDASPAKDPLPYTVKLDIPSSIAQQTFRYTDSCGRMGEVPIGRQIEKALREEASRTFKTVVSEPDRENVMHTDHVMTFEVREWSFHLDKDALYDRAPATFRMNALVRTSDSQGAVLRETEFRVDRRERLRLEQVGRNCDYVISPFIRDTAEELAAKVFLDARLAFGEHPSSSSVSQESASHPSAFSATDGSPPSAMSSTSSALRFKALLLDENGDLILESGEHVRIRVDVVNTGAIPAQDVSVSLTGTPEVLNLFPATTLTLPPLQPTQTKSLEFMATLPPTLRPLQAEIHVTLTQTGKPVAPPQTLLLTIQPAGSSLDDVDRIPALRSAFERPGTHLIAIGISNYPPPQAKPRKYSSMDAQRIADYFQAIGGVPASNVMLLRDLQAHRAAVDDAFTKWLPRRTDKNAVVIVYFSGQAMVAPNGEVLLALSDASRADASRAADARLYPLRLITSTIATLNVQQTIFIFDGSVSKLHGESDTQTAIPHWDLNGTAMIQMIAGESFKTGLEDDAHRHGLFTYYFLRGLRGEADTNQNGFVTLGELGGYVRQKVTWAAKSRFNTEQRPMIVPTFESNDTVGSLVLSAPAALASTHHP
ncbi:MAG: caspase family protein [Nitrospira sp.]|nr:caspase family protein [Nitrospira sp.]MCP9461515.1 caspase family protein [Nitrospira sp.]MCP9473971.1 caspase family protein [Nitrospira sp.]